MKRVLTDHMKSEIVKHVKNGDPEGIVCSFNPELEEVDLQDLNDYLLGFGMEASYNQVLKKRKLVQDKKNIFVYRKEAQNVSL